VRLTVPLLLVVLGELIAERSGVINIGLEGKMLAGAYAGFLVMADTQSVVLSALAAMIAGSAVAVIMCGLAIWQRINQILVGFGIFVMVPGFVAFLHQQQERLIVTPLLETWAIPGLSDIPLIGRALFAQNVFYYTTVALCIVVWILLNKTRFGLSLSACGHQPEVALSKGISVTRTRIFATLICGVLAGLGGAALSVGALGSFTGEITDGRGFIAIAVVILGRWQVGWAVIAALAIGLSEAFRLRLGSQIDLPVQILAMLPWIVVLIMLVAGARFTNIPRALGRNLGVSQAVN